LTVSLYRLCKFRIVRGEPRGYLLFSILPPRPLAGR